MNPYQLNFLTGEEDWYAARKSFSQEAAAANLISDYQLGKYFCHHTEQLAEGAELMSLMEVLGRVGDMPRTLRVYAHPQPFARKGDVLERNGDFMEEPAEGVRLLIVDVDGWETDTQWWRGRASLREALHSLLEERGLDYLYKKECVCMLSQGAWPGGVLKAHLYYWMEEPIMMEDLRRWAAAVNERCGAKVIDPAVYRAVQPDYTARRACVDFADPFDDSKRVQIIDAIRGAEEANLSAGMRREIELAEKRIGAPVQSSGAVIGEVEGDGWTTVSRAGEGGEINEWCFRAAAKIVQREGRENVLARLRDMATRMHSIAWEGIDGLGGIVINSSGARGGKADVQVYVVARFEQYLRSACDRRFGDEVDRLKAVVSEASNRSISSLFDEPVVHAAERLRSGWPGAFQEVRAAVKSLRGLQIGVWEDQLDRRAKEVRTDNRRLTAEEGLATLDLIEGGLEGVGDGAGDILEDGTLREIPYCNAIMSSLDWIANEDSTVFFDRLDTGIAGRGGYRTLGIESIGNFIMRRGAEIIHSLGGSVSPDWTVKRVLGYIDAEIKGSGGVVGSKRWGRRKVADRYFVSGRGVLWINLGCEGEDVLTGEGGKFCCLRCDEKGKQRMTWLEALERHEDAPVWRFNDVAVMAGANDADCMAGYLTDVDGIEAGLKKSRDGAWLEKMWRLVRLESDFDEGRVLAWLVSVVLNWDTKFILQLNGQQGSGKSVTGDILCGLVDPMSNDRVMENMRFNRRGASALKTENVAMTLKGKTTLMLDNFSSLTGHQQDVLCSIATGMSADERVLYTNMVVKDRLNCSLVLSGINSVVTRPDLADRVYSVDVRGAGVGEGYVNRLSDRFEEWRSEIFDGIVMLAMKVRKVMAEDGGVVGDRGALTRVVESLYWGARDGAIILGVVEGEAGFDLLVGDAFASCFCAWLLTDKECWGELGLHEGRWISPTELYESYREWFFKVGIGNEYLIEGAGGVGFTVRVVQDRREKKLGFPVNQNSFSRKFNRFTEVMSRFICGTSHSGTSFWVRRRVKGKRQLCVKTVHSGNE